MALFAETTGHACDVPQVIAACCVQHNVCEIHGDAFNEQWMEGVRRQESECASASSASILPEASAVEICNPWQQSCILM